MTISIVGDVIHFHGEAVADIRSSVLPSQRSDLEDNLTNYERAGLLKALDEAKSTVDALNAILGVSE